VPGPLPLRTHRRRVRRSIDPTQDHPMKLYYHPASTTSRIVMLCAAEEGIALEQQVVDLFTGEHMKPPFSALNPNCLVPMIEDGDFRLTECSAIVKFLAEQAGSPAYPKALRPRAKVNEMMDWFNTNLYRDLAYGLVYPQTFPSHKRRSDEAQASTLEWAKEKSKFWLQVLDQHLIGPKNNCLVGDSITVADYLGAEMVGLADLIRCDLSAYANVQRWMQRMKSLKSWASVNEVIYGFGASLKDTPFVRL
jgi:glutathione S-transferase